MKASQKPPRIFRISVITEECFDSRIFAAIKIAEKIKKVSAYSNRLFRRAGESFVSLCRINKYLQGNKLQVLLKKILSFDISSFKSGFMIIRLL